MKDLIELGCAALTCLAITSVTIAALTAWGYEKIVTKPGPPPPTTPPDDYHQPH